MIRYCKLDERGAAYRWRTTLAGLLASGVLHLILLCGFAVSGKPAFLLRRTAVSLAVLLIAGSSLIAGCEKPVPPPTVPSIANATDPQWVYRSTPNAKVAVVFVHGIFGDTLGTWRTEGGETFFRLLNAQPGVGSQVDIFAFGFTSNMFKAGSFSVQEAANKLHESLQYKGVLDYPSVVFVGHSMGGLVVLRELLTRRDMLDKVPLVVFYSTPQEGAQIAAIAKDVAKNPGLADMVPGDKNAFLQVLNDEWKSLKSRPRLVCGYEKLDTFSVPIVPWTSATRFCDGAAAAIEADHMSIVKPDRLEHPSMVVLVNALNSYVIGKQLTAKLETPDFLPEGNQHIFILSDVVGRSTARLVNAGGGRLTYTLAQVSDPHLFLWPDDTPRDILARQTQRMSIGLGFGAPAKEYRFVLQSDVSKDQVVIVRANNLSDLMQKQARLLDSVANDMNKALQDKATIKRLKEGSKKQAEDEVVETVRTALARENSELPESAQWVFAASFLNASNLPTLAASALRRAEALSPATAKSSSVRWLAGAIAAQSGAERVFASAETPKLKLEDLPKSQLVVRLLERGQADKFSLVAKHLQEIPTLRPYGFSLEGDILLAGGNRQAAYEAYTSAANLDGSPSLSQRMNELVQAKKAPGPRTDQRKPGASSTVPPRGAVERVPFRSGDSRTTVPGSEATQSGR